MTITNPTITVDPHSKLPHGTVRRAPSPSFAHAILLDQFGKPETWLIIDVYGSMEVETDVDVKDWPIVYIPTPDEVWTQVVPPYSPDDEVQTGIRYCERCGCAEYLHRDGKGKCVGPMQPEGCAQECTYYQPPLSSKADVSPMSLAIRLCRTCRHLSARHLRSDGGKCEDCEKNCTAFLAEAPDGSA